MSENQSVHRPSAGLSKGQLGRYGEDLACLVLGRLGWDVYRAAVDDKGIDLVVRYPDGRHADVQVKAIRPRGKSSYVFFRKEYFAPVTSLLVVLVVCEERHDSVYLVPSTVWLHPNELFVERDYGPGLKSPPEFGLAWSNARRDQLEEHRLATIMIQ
jgi:hypothetical protein